MIITTLIENNPDESGNLIDEHGLSFHIELNGKNILFDTGASEAFIQNAKKMEVSLTNLDYVMISHGHYDHAGGFLGLKPYLNNQPNIVFGQGFFNGKYRHEGGKFHYNGIPFKQEDVGFDKVEIITADKDFGDFIVFKNDVDVVSERYVVEKDGKMVSDDFNDEILMGIKKDDGLILVIGCCHMKIENLIATIQNKGYAIKGIIGGIHESKSDDVRINEIIDLLEPLELEIISLCHCTGDRFVELARERGLTVIKNHTGKKICL